MLNRALDMVTHCAFAYWHISLLRSLHTIASCAIPCTGLLLYCTLCLLQNTV